MRKVSFFLSLFYMALKANDIIPFEEYYYVRTMNHNRIYTKEDIEFVQTLIQEAEEYDYE